MAGLEDLPEELIDLTVQPLGFSDVANLRLTSRSLAAKCSHGHFRTYFHHKQLDLSEETVRTFAEITKRPSLSSLVRSLTISAERGHVASEETYVAALVTGFTNSTALSKVALEVHEVDENGRHSPSLVMYKSDDGVTKLVPNLNYPEWQETWTTAASLFRVVMAAFSASKTRIEAIDVFGNTDRCSLANDELRWAVDNAFSSRTQLRSLSLSLSHQVKHGVEPEASAAPLTNTREDVVSFARSLETVLQQCPLLESLELHWFKIKKSAGSDIELSEGRFLNFFDAAPRFERLRSCTLRGIHADSDALLRFLSNAPLQKITLKDVYLTQGTFRPIFDHIVQCPLQELHFDSLGEPARLSFPNGKGKARIHRSGRHGPDYLLRQGAEEARKHIRYVLLRGRAKGSGLVWIANAWRRVQYGPPDGGAHYLDMRWMAAIDHYVDFPNYLGRGR